jgi:hypothetical protein
VKGIQSEGAFLSIQTFRAIQKMDEWQDFIHAGGSLAQWSGIHFLFAKKIW